MRKSCLALCFSLIFYAGIVYADCPPGTNWTAAWTDVFGETTYTLEAPCKVYIGIPFTLTATVTDSIWPDSIIAFSWAVKDNGVIIAGSARQNWLRLTGGQWQQVIEQTYTGTPVDHLIEFKFTDLGSGSSPHHWATTLIGNITVDPYPPSDNTPPEVNAGPDIMISGQDQTSTVIHGTAADADGDSLTYRWLEGTTELQPARPVGPSGDAPLPLSALLPLTIGTHAFTLEVSDGQDASSDTVNVSVENSPPTVVPSGSGTYQIRSAISLSGSLSDYDGDTLTYTWLEGSSILFSGTVDSVFGGAPITIPVNVIADGLPLGTHTLTLEVSDGIHTVSSNITITVVDTIAPTLAPVADKTILWPPNHKMVEVAINANASDNSGGPVLLAVMVNSNELPGYDKDGNLIPDYSIVQIDQLSRVIYLELRAAREGNKGERIYTVTIVANDESGNSSSADVRIKVPHDMRKN